MADILPPPTDRVPTPPFIACGRAELHTIHCSMTGVPYGHPHTDCYCGVYWNDAEPKQPCPECGDA